jgi:adenine deaminase
MNRVVRHAISEGLKPITAIQMATLNTAQHFGLERELGSITPGRRADVIISSDLSSLPIEEVVAQGVPVASHGRLNIDIPAFSYPQSATNTVNMGRKLKSQDFQISAPDNKSGTVEARVIGVIENQAPTKALTHELKVQEGIIQMDVDKDVCQIALVERHRGTGAVVNGFVSGFRYNKSCAVASTVAHDSHHMIVVGTHHEDMALAANRLGEVGGGVTVFSGGKELALVELPIAGLMSNERAEIVADKAQAMVHAMMDCGCDLNNAYMQHSLLALVVIPELRISDVGLIDVNTFSKTDLLV